MLMKKEKRKRNESPKGCLLNFFSVSSNDVPAIILTRYEIDHKLTKKLINKCTNVFFSRNTTRQRATSWYHYIWGGWKGRGTKSYFLGPEM